MERLHNKIGIYIHVPFCNSRCSYCDFYSTVNTDKEKEEYINAMLNKLTTQPFGARVVDTLYFGGGTPSVLGSSQLTRIINAVKESFFVEPDAQITVEANPESIDYHSLLELKKAGVNRVSFGVQSSIPKELETLGRMHTASKAKDAIMAAKKAGIEHISADLMLGIPYQTEKTAYESLEFIAALPVDHISVYMLSVEEGTPISRLPLDEITMPEEVLARVYIGVVTRLEERGFMQYEISNFAKPDGISKHNIKYWLMGDYLGIGPSAHSFIDGKRFEFPSSTSEFVKLGWNVVKEDNDSVGDSVEYAMLRLRLKSGLDLKEYKARYPEVHINKITQKAREFKQLGYLEIANDTIFFTKEGFLLSNHIIAELIL